MIALEFPPANTTGNYRSAGFARSLIQQGHQVSVITLTEQSAKETFNVALEKSLLEGLDQVNYLKLDIVPLSDFQKLKRVSALRIFWNTTDNLFKRLFSKINQQRIDDFVAKVNPDIVYVSLPPFSMAYLAEYITDKFKKPLVVDMRDGWSLWGAAPFQTKWHYKKILRNETKLLSKAAAIITVTPEFTQLLQKQHQHLDKKLFHTVMNGYDQLGSQLTHHEIVDDSLIRIGYIGSFYYTPSSDLNALMPWYKRNGIRSKLAYYHRLERWIYRSPYFFLKAIQHVKKENPQIGKQIIFELIGNEPVWLVNMIKDLGLENNFKSHGFKSKQEVLNILGTWHGVLATSEKIIKGEHFSLPSKIFDAIAAQKPILSFGTPGTQTNFLKNYKQTIFFNPDDTPEAAQLLKQFCNKPFAAQTTPLLAEHSRVELSKSLEEIFNNIIYKN